MLGNPPVTVAIPGASATIGFSIDELFPVAAPRRARITVRVERGGSGVSAGDRDALLDERAATVAARAGEVVTLDLGLDESREGWRYRGALVRIGSAFSWTNDRYEASGTVLSMNLDGHTAMTENDFPALRSAVRDSLIGRTIASVTAATIGAASSATSTRLITSQANEFRGLTAAEAIRTGAIALLTACIAIWALSLVVPLYVSTAIPGSVFLVLALLCAAAAASCNALAEHWPHSRLRRLTAWLRGA